MGPTRTKNTTAKERSTEPTMKVELNEEKDRGHGPAKESKSPKVALVRMEEPNSLEINASLHVPCETEPPTVAVSTEEPRSPEINVRFADVFEHETESSLKNKEPEKSNVANSSEQSEAEPPAHQTEQPKKPRLGSVLIWGKLFDDWNGVGRHEPRDDKDQVGVDANPNSDDEEQSQNGKVNGEENCERNVGDAHARRRRRKRPHNQRHRTKPKRENQDSELITKTEHLRILRSALRNMMQCRVREVLGLGEGEMAEPTDEVSQALRGDTTTTRKRRGRKCKVVTRAENAIEGEGAVAINPSTKGANNQEENGEITQDLDDDSAKPRTTYRDLIKIALDENPEGMTISAIYNWMSNRYPSFQMNDASWKNSVRHNLSINPYFEKHTQDMSNVRGSIWKISEKYGNCSKCPPPPPMNRRKSVSRPQEDDPEMPSGELNNIMQYAGFGEVTQECVPMDMVQDPLLLTEAMQHYTLEGLAGPGGEPWFGQDGNFAYGDLSFPPEKEYPSIMLSEFSADGGGQITTRYEVIGSVDVSGMDPEFGLNVSNINMA